MTKYCEICSLELHDDYAYQNHLIGKKHLKNVQHKEFEKRIVEFSIFVSPLPKSVSPRELIKFFLQFGPIQKHKKGGNYLIIEFTSSEPVEYLLNNPIWINKTKLDIKRRTLFNNPKKLCNNNSTEEEDAISFVSIRSKFENETSFDSQLIAFLDAVQLSNVEVETRYNFICQCLDNIFASVFPHCRTYRFGSSLTGLGFKECDLDIYMDIGAPVFIIDEKTRLPQSIAKELPHLWTMSKIFKRVKNVMYRRRDVFTNIRPIPKARTPIIKFCHVPTKISCDISFKNGFAVYNSLLVKHCLSCDVRIKPLMILIKYWARHCKISGCGKMSNYALVLLIIFYLQQAESGILPPLMIFQQTCVPRIINGWQVNFDENTVLPQISNNSSIPELLQGFFEFYANFNFKRNIVCTLDGIIHTKQEFEETENLPSHMARYKDVVTTEDLKLDITKFICIQDPIELNRNVATCTSQRLIESFQVFCEISAEICTSTRANDYKNLLVSLLSSVHAAETDLKFVITIKAERYLNVGLPDDFNEREDIIDKDQYKKDNWFFTVFNIVKDIFEKVYKLEVEILSADKEAKQQKIEVLSDVHTKEHKHLLLHCKGNECAWYKRKCQQIILDPSMSALDKEIAISNKVIEKHNNKIDSTKTALDFMCKFQKRDNPVQVQLVITNKNSTKQQFNTFKGVSVGKIPKIITKTLAHMLQFKKHY